jgi:hypothetical protein
MHNKCTIYIYYNILPHITINGYRIGGKFFWPQAYARIARIEEESVEIDHGPYQQGPDGCLILALLAPAILGLNHDINIYSWRFPKIWVLHGTPKSSLFIGFSMIFHHKLAGNHGFFTHFWSHHPALPTTCDFLGGEIDQFSKSVQASNSMMSNLQRNFGRLYAAQQRYNEAQ